jgi:nucleoside-diphosphate-sugar epimerase
MRILLTGSTGWLGRYLAPMLRAAGHEVIGMDVAPGPDTRVVGSVADRALVERVMFSHGIEGVIHGAALHKPDIVRYPRQAFIDVNVTGTLNLIECAIAAGADRFVFSSTTSLMITQAIYGVTKRAAEEVCRLVHSETGLPIIVLRTSRFFPEDDDTHRDLSGENMKANEFLNRRLTVEDCARAHIAALDRAPAIGFATYIASAPTPFSRDDVVELKTDAPAVIARLFPDAAELFAARGWSLPASIGRVYDAGAIELGLGFRCVTDFSAILAALRENGPMPFQHDASYSSPKE